MNKNQFVPADHKEIAVGPSEHGGSTTVTFYFSSNYKPVEKKQATRAIVHEYDDKGRSIYREYFVLREGEIIPSDSLSDADFSDGFEDKIVVPRRKNPNAAKNSQNQKNRSQRSRSSGQRKQNTNRKPNENKPASKKQQPSANRNSPKKKVAAGARASDIPNRPKRSTRSRNQNNQRPKPTEAP